MGEPWFVAGGVAYGGKVCKLTREIIMRKINIQLMAKHYLSAAIWADAPEGTGPRITKQAKNKALAICEKFSNAIEGELWDAILDNPDYWAHPDCGGYAEGAIGHDLYLTSVGHGVGFWDRDTLPNDLGDKLTEIAQGLHVDMEFYRGWLYIH